MFIRIFRRESGSAYKIPSQMAFKRKQPDATHNCIFYLPLSPATSFTYNLSIINRFIHKVSANH